ncbi:Hsp20 family protein [Brasilonema bromeliae]|uniref:Hsp20/alpha crystallin family protein n=2 Tax=Bromeliae group (in: Brasilonema) TaxID=3398495 RepID=A0ABX1P6N7_9CYAN|nr:Hsp20/alpha crystallin family protein [Brasilonema bromeliae SPC951]
MLSRWNPRQEFNALSDQLNRLFDETLAPARNWEGFTKFPAAELTEADDAIHLKLEVPGLEAKDIDIQVTENAVAISGERKSETKTEGKGYTRSEFQYGKFQRVIPLPTHIQNTKVTAEYTNGILNLTLPKKEEAKNKVVKVNLE